MGLFINKSLRAYHPGVKKRKQFFFIDYNTFFGLIRPSTGYSEAFGDQVVELENSFVYAHSEVRKLIIIF